MDTTIDTRVGLLVADSCAASLAAIHRDRDRRTRAHGGAAGGEAGAAGPAELEELVFDELVAVGLSDPELPLAVLLAPLAGAGALLSAMGTSGGGWHPAELGRAMVTAGSGASEVQLALQLLPVAVLTVNGHHDALADSLDEHGFPFGCPVAECLAAAVALLAVVVDRVPDGVDAAALVRRAIGRVCCRADEVGAVAVERWFAGLTAWEPVSRSADRWAVADPASERRAALAAVAEVLVHSVAAPPPGSVCVVAMGDGGPDAGHRIDSVTVEEGATADLLDRLPVADALALAVLRVSGATVRCVVVDRRGGEAVAAAAADGPAASSATLPGEAGHGRTGEPLLAAMHRALAVTAGESPVVSPSPLA